MEYRVYNENGVAKVTKVCKNGNESLMFKLTDGEVAVLEVVAHLHTGENTKKCKIEDL